MRVFKIVIPLLCTFICMGGASAVQAGPVENGIAWLKANQHPDGFWGGEATAITTAYHSTSVVAETFQYLRIAGGSLTSAIAWVSAQDILTVDHLSRQIEVLAQAGIDVPEKVNILLSYRQPDGGWGINADGASDVLDTALVLQALKAASCSDTNTISSALGYLVSTQNLDGGWGFYPSACSGCDPDPSNVYMTAIVLTTLSQYKTIYNLEAAINHSAAYLLAKQNLDGGFGSSPSTVYETALTFLALVASGVDISSIAPQAINYLTANQLPNGSWNDDPYSTALAIRALAHVKPNLSILPADIVFSNPNPRMGETITVTAAIYNEGPATANNIVVQFYDGDPSSAGVLIGGTTIPTINAFSNSQTNVNWTVSTASLRKVFVRIDPLDTIHEIDETDNMAFRNLTSSTLPDLTLGAADITFSPDPVRIGEPVTVTVAVRNNGQSEAQNFLVYVYAGDPGQGGSKIAESTYSTLAGGRTNSFQFIWTVSQGVDRISVRIDPMGQVTESNENNNQAYRLLAAESPPVEGIDLVAVPNSFSFSPGIGQEGKPVTITASVFNNGTVGATSITVDFFDAGPSGSIQKIYGTLIPFLGPGQKLSVSHQSSLTKGSHTICMKVDPQNLIQEVNENNDELCAGLTVIEGSIEDTLTIPRNLRGTSTRNSISIRWDAVTRQDLAGYFVYRDGIQLNPIPIQQEGYADSGLPSGTLYHYQVSSADDLGIESAKSEILAISTTIHDIDLRVDYGDVNITPEDAQPGQTVTIQAKIRNLGTDPVSNVVVNIYTLESPINTISIPSIGPGGEYLVQTNWVVTDPNDFIYIQIDPDNIHLEMDEFNNLAIVSIVRNVRFIQVNQVINDSYRAMGDLNNDGALDILDAYGSVLLVNDGHGNFTPLRPDRTGFRTKQDYSSAFGDIDNDGFLDVFICSTTGDNRLYKNNGNLTFTDITQQAGLSGINTYTVNAVFGDLNNDGHLDLFVGAFGGDHYIYLNNGDGTFTRVLPSFSEGFENVELGDLDGDGYLDVVVCSDGNAVIYKNDGTGHFIRYLALPGSFWDVALGDIDNDGHLDIVTLNPGRVFYNDGQGNFSLANSVDLPGSGVYTISLADFDNDGDLDIFYSDYGYLIRNDGNRKFTDISALFNHAMPWYTVLLGDIDNDGDVDIVGGQYIYRNEMNNNNFLIFSLRGIESNYYGIGSKMRVYEEGHLGEKSYLKGFRQVQAGGQGYVSMDSSDAHFGLNSNYRYDIQVEFPASGIVVNRRGTSTGRKLILPEYGDLYVNTEGISFSPEVPVDGDDIIVTAVIHNPTAIDMENVVIGFYDGNPLAEGIELGRVKMGYVPAEGEKAFPLQIALSEGVHEIYVLIDPDNTLREKDKANNIAFRAVTVQPRFVDQDLSINASDIGVNPSAPWDGAKVILSAFVRSSGTKDIPNVLIVFYDGDPSQGGDFVDQTVIPIIPANGNAQTQVQWDTLGKSGVHYIHVVVDPQNLVKEINENNNSALVSVDVTSPSKPDLAIEASDITFSNLNPQEGEQLTINATVQNLGTATSGIEVFLYDGDPSQGGILLNQKTIPWIVPLGGKAGLNFDVRTVGFAGNHNFFISIDPNNRIDEMMETNNIAWNSQTIGSSGLGLGISTDKPVYTANEEIQIRVKISNLENKGRAGSLLLKIVDLNDNSVATVNTQEVTLNPNENKVSSYAWNTGKTLSDSYRVHGAFVEGSNVISRANTPITITPVRNITSKVTTDKISYTANQSVTITSTVRSISPNYIFSNLHAKTTITDSQGQNLFSDSRSISNLTPDQLFELKTYWNSAANLKGTYSVRLEVFEYAVGLGTATANFEIQGSKDTGEGLIGTLTAQPSLVLQGKDETLTYSITNKGNEDMSNLSVKVLIVNPDTQEIKNRFETIVTSLPMNTTLAANAILSTSNLTPRTHIAILQVSSAIMAEPKTLAKATFEVKPGIEVTKTIPDVTNLLVWVNDSCKPKRDQEKIGPQCREEDEKCVRVDLLEKILKEEVTSYFIFDEGKDFKGRPEIPYFTDFLILGNHHPLEDHYADILREYVHTGKGLISSLYMKHGEDHKEDYDPLFGITYKGRLPGDEHTVNLVESVISEPGILSAEGEAVKIETDGGTTIAGWLVSERDDHCKKENYPAIVLNEYGEGKTIYYAFDLGLTLHDENYDQLSEILRNSIQYTHKPIDTTSFRPYQTIPMEVKLKSLGGPFDLKISVTYPQEFGVYDPVTGSWVTDNPWILDFHLGPDETRAVLFYLLAPDQEGNYTIGTEVGYVENGAYYPYQNLSTEILVAKKTASITDEILSALSALTVSKGHKAKVDNAINYISNVRKREVVSPQDVEKNIRDILKAINSILFITSADISGIRFMMDGLLEIWVSRRYLDVDLGRQRQEKG